MDDLISRRAAIDAICEHGTELERRRIMILAVANHKQVAVDLLEALPSAEPEIIRCKDCEYGKLDEDGYWYCRDIGCQMGDGDGNGFCSEAEKKAMKNDH